MATDPTSTSPGAEPPSSRRPDRASESPWDALVPPAAEEEAAPTYLDRTVEETALELDEVPEWLGIRWRELPQESMPLVWRWLREWVDWLVEAHRIPNDEVPPCWYRHQDIVEELWAAANAEVQAWEATTPTMTPMTAWQFHLRMMRDRLNGKAKECVATQQHVEKHSFRPGWTASALVVDEHDWAAHLAEITDTQPAPVPRSGITSMWRMCAVDSTGEITTSDALLLEPTMQREVACIVGPARRGADAEGSALLGATVCAGEAAIERTWWEFSDDGLTWQRVVTSEVDRTTVEENTDVGHEQVQCGEDEQA